MAKPPRVSVVPIESLTCDPENARLHNHRNIDLIQESIHAVGAARSGVIDEDGIIRAGNGMHEAAMLAGLREAIIIETDGQRPVFVKRTGLSREQKIRLAIDDNRTQETSSFDAATVAKLADEFPVIKRAWTPAEWAELMQQAEDEAAGDEDAAGGAGDPHVTCPKCGHVFTPTKERA